MIFDKHVPFTYLEESDKELKTLLNYNPQHNEYTKNQNIPERDPNETDRGGWRGYDKVYSKYLTDRKHKIHNLLEIGVYYGYGLLTWARYFDDAKIYGIDIFMSEQQMMEIIDIRHKFDEYKRVKIFLSDSTKEEMWLQFNENFFDVIIDDGRHHPTTQIKTLECAWKYLTIGGTYFIEDVSHRYGEEYISMLSNKLLELSKENHVTIYSHQNLGLRRMRNNKIFVRNGIINFDNPTEYIVVIQKL